MFYCVFQVAKQNLKLQVIGCDFLRADQVSKYTQEDGRCLGLLLFSKDIKVLTKMVIFVTL